jgi:hypothetical protein
VGGETRLKQVEIKDQDLPIETQRYVVQYTFTLKMQAAHSSEMLLTHAQGYTASQPARPQYNECAHNGIAKDFEFYISGRFL